MTRDAAANSRDIKPGDGQANAGDLSLWPRVRRWLVPLFVIVVLGLLLSHAHKIDWEGGWQALKQYPRLLLLGVLGLATASHCLYACFDLIGRRHTHHGLSALRTWAIALTSYAFNLNLGSLVGGVAMRVRLYAKAGLDQATIAQVVGLSLATNWLGYALLAGGLFASGVITPPFEAHLGLSAFRLLGGLMMLIAVAYVIACGASNGRTWQVRGRQLRLPSARLAIVQLLLSTTNWALMGSAMYLLLQGEVSYGMTLGVLLAAAIVGVITPIPAGLGVLEAVYLSLLSGTVEQGALIGAILAYRALYYVVPLMGGLVVYLVLERYAVTHPASEGAANEKIGVDVASARAVAA